jgi:hypothetical protein
MLVHIIMSCPAVHSLFIPKPSNAHSSTAAFSTLLNDDDRILTLEEIINEDMLVLPFGITCINIVLNFETDSYGLLPLHFSHQKKPLTMIIVPSPSPSFHGVILYIG